MKLHSPIATVALMLPTLTLAAYWESPFLKSFDEAQQECVEYIRLPKETVDRFVRNGYPDEPAVRELVYCILLDVSAWNVTTGVRDHVFSNFFEPSCSDSYHKDRTQECLRETVDCLPRHDQLGRAYKSFQCYYRNYGNVAKARQFVPFFNSTRKQLYKDSIVFKNVPQDVLVRFAKGDILDTEQFGEVYYTYVLSTGFYNPEVGVNYDWTFIEFGNPEIISEETRSCGASIRRQYCDEPKRLVETFKQCLKDHVTSLATIQEAAKELLEEIPAADLPPPSQPTCSSCGSPAPCRTCNDIYRFNVHRPCYNGQCY